MTPPDSPSWRKPAGIFVILALVAFWAIVVTSVMDWIGPLPVWAELCMYGVAGIIWIAPLRPLLMWMETGQWRE